MTATTAPLHAPWYVDKKDHLPLEATWSRRISSSQQVPADFQDALPDASPFPYVVFLPGESDGFIETAPRQLVALSEKDVLHMIRKDHKEPVISTVYPLETITHVEHGQSLFQSWLEIKTSSHAVAIVFPSVAEHLFMPVIDAILTREAQKDSQEFVRPEHQAPAANLDYLRKANLKFFNAVSKYVTDEDRILETAYQPEVELSNVRIFGWSIGKKSVADHLAVLTDRALILLKEGQTAQNHDGEVFGKILTYIPISQIRHLAFEEHAGPLDCVMHIVLSDNTSLRTGFSTETTENLAKFREACLRTCVRPS
jgi:hypothetical protein